MSRKRSLNEAQNSSSLLNCDPYKDHFCKSLDAAEVRKGEAKRFDFVDELSVPELNELKSRIKQNLVENGPKNNPTRRKELFTDRQQRIFGVLSSYEDMYWSCDNNSAEMCYLYCMHIANHILKNRTCIMAHNKRIKDYKESHPACPLPESLEDECRDQNLARPRVLVLVPFRRCAFDIVNLLIRLLFGKQVKEQMVLNKKRFTDEFEGDSEKQYEEDSKGRRSSFLPADHTHRFRGNTDDCFRVGISLTKKCLKLFVPFEKSDIILASPLGLRMAMGAEGDEEFEYDFLSGLEVVIMDESDVFLMQNWMHVLHIFENMNLKPKDTSEVDISRVRESAVNNLTKYLRQTILLSSIPAPELRSIFSRFCYNINGLVVISHQFPANGALGTIELTVPQAFQRVDCANPADAVEKRFKHFKEKIFPHYKDSQLSHVLIFVSSYLDFVKLRNFMKKLSPNLVQICEYSEDKKVSRSRDLFYHGKKAMLLFTERFHFYHRYWLKGIEHIIFYQLPLYPKFYTEMLEMMKGGTDDDGSGSINTVTALYSKFDAIRLAAVVGEKKAKIMIEADSNLHVLAPQAK